jgi:hypothetical protein
MNSKELIDWLREKDISITEVDMQELLKLYALVEKQLCMYNPFTRVFSIKTRT